MFCVCVCLLILSSFTFILSILCPWGASGLRLPGKLSQIEFRLAGRYRPHPDHLELERWREREKKNNHSTHHSLENLPSNFFHCLSFLPSLPVSPSFSSTLLISLLPLFLLLAHYSSASPFYITPRVSSLVFVCLNRYTSVFPCSACLFLFFDDSLPSCSSPSIPSPQSSHITIISLLPLCPFLTLGFYLSFAPSSHPLWLAVPSDI